MALSSKSSSGNEDAFKRQMSNGENNDIKWLVVSGLPSL
jgi:hypothetical protein